MFIVTKNIDSENISKLCRTCLREDSDKMVCLFIGPPGSSLAAKLRSLSCLEVWQGDGLPEKMCDRCVTLAESALLYREQCRVADRALRQAAVKVSGQTSYTTTLLNNKLYNQNTDFSLSENVPRTHKCEESLNVFLNDQELQFCDQSHASCNSGNNISAAQHRSIQESQFPDNDFTSHAQFSSNNSNHNTKFTSRIEIKDPNMITDCHTVKEKLSSDISHNFELADSSIIQRTIFVNDQVNIRQENSTDFQSSVSLKKEYSEIDFKDKFNMKNLNVRFKCFTCDKSYASKSKLSAHVKLHLKKNVHKCNICAKIFTYPSYLKEHMKVHNVVTVKQNSEYFECYICNKRFCILKNLNAHMKFHSGKGLLQCNYCEKKFSKKYSLKIHLSTHEARKVHECKYCNKSFIQKSNLVEHVRTHTKVKPYECNLCDKRFCQSSHLKSHIASHYSDKQHHCNLCGKKFKLSNHLKRHLNSHTGLKSHRCKKCNQMFSQAFSLRRHLKKHEEC